MQIAAEDLRPTAAAAPLGSLRGHLVRLPHHFLAEEDLQLSVADSEFILLFSRVHVIRTSYNVTFYSQFERIHFILFKYTLAMYIIFIAAMQQTLKAAAAVDSLFAL